MKPVEIDEADLVYDAREATWGHHIAWFKWLRLEDPPDNGVASFFGHVTPRPKPEQNFIMLMGEGVPVLYAIEWINFPMERADTFFCDATLLGAVLEEAEDG